MNEGEVTARSERPGRRRRSSICFCTSWGGGPTATTSCRPVFSSSICAMRSPSRCAPTGRFGAVRAPRASRPRRICACVRRTRSRPRPAVRWAPTSACSSEFPWARASAAAAPMRPPACVALNQLWGLHWPAEELAALGLKLGADVPVFVHGRAALGGGSRGAADAALPAAGAPRG